MKYVFTLMVLCACCVGIADDSLSGVPANPQQKLDPQAAKSAALIKQWSEAYEKVMKVQYGNLDALLSNGKGQVNLDQANSHDLNFIAASQLNFELSLHYRMAFCPRMAADEATVALVKRQIRHDLTRLATILPQTTFGQTERYGTHGFCGIQNTLSKLLEQQLDLPPDTVRALKSWLDESLVRTPCNPVENGGLKCDMNY